jgi:predicted alpha/beta hydrolase
MQNVKDCLETPVRFKALDGYELGGILYGAESDSGPGRAALLSCGGGVPALRYARFARYLAAEGVPVLTYDYRGIGMSRVGSLRGFNATGEDWSELDSGGAIEYLRDRFPIADLVGMAHSIGTLLLGGAPNATSLSRFVFISAHTACLGDYLPRYQIPMALFWHVCMPIITSLVGFFPGRALGIGEDIPKGVALQWGARRTARKSSNASPRLAQIFDRAATLKGPVLVLGTTDDAYATPAATSRLLRAYASLASEVLWYSPDDIGVKRLGHFGIFRRNAERVIWPRIVNFVTR